MLYTTLLLLQLTCLRAGGRSQTLRSSEPIQETGQTLSSLILDNMFNIIALNIGQSVSGTQHTLNGQRQV